MPAMCVGLLILSNLTLFLNGNLIRGFGAVESSLSE